MKSTTSSRFLAPVVLGLLVVALALGGHKARQWLAPQEAVRLAHDAACDLHAGPCELPLPGGGRVRLSVAPRPIPVLKPLEIRVELTGVEADAVSVDFSGVDMNMGLNRFPLSRGGDGIYAGGGLLPVCVRNSMLWEAAVLAETDRGLIAAPFRFTTVRP